MTSAYRIDPETWSVTDAATQLQAACFATRRTAATEARRRAEFTLDPDRAAFWLAVAAEIAERTVRRER